VTERKDIGLRLEAWSRWATARASRGADCMTGAICEALRRSALGDVWSGHEVKQETDEADCMAIERGMPLLPVPQRLLLYWCYIEQARPEVVCRKVSIPKADFVERFRAAQEAIEDIVDGGNR
jgi:hypothetical protein